jgi:adenylosuccinate lyase
MSLDFSSYLSPFSWRYGSPEMRALWSEANKRRLWRRLWVALAEVQAEYGLVRPEQVEDLRQHQEELNIERALPIEAEIHHDLMAELRTFAEQAPLGGGILHLGATSMDIEDNADALRLRQALELILDGPAGRGGQPAGRPVGQAQGLRGLLLAYAEKIEIYADLPLMAFTHLQPAEPSTLGYRLALYAQDLLLDWEALGRARRGLKGKGFKGAVGTGAAYAELIGAEKLAEFEAKLSSRLGLSFFPVASQVYPRKQDYAVMSALAGLGASLYKFAFDLRLLQSPPVGELSEPFGRKQVGSSAMPFKRNPINAEKIDSLARLLAQAPRLAWDNTAHSLLERTLDDSANRRTLLPEAFLAADELLRTTRRIVDGLVVNETAMRRNLEIYGPFAAIERVMMALARAGADRQEMHERLRGHAMMAWEVVQQGKPNPLAELVSRDEILLSYLSADELLEKMDAQGHLGDAPARARQMASSVREIVLI